jgi:hypothetical protein
MIFLIIWQLPPPAENPFMIGSNAACGDGFTEARAA